MAKKKKIASFINQKGGVGKSPWALTVAMDLGLYLITNDDSVVEKAYPDMAQIQMKPSLIDDCVYDFGGFASSDMLHIIKNSDIILIPCDKKIDSKQRTIKTIKNIEKYNNNIFIIATDYKNDKELENIKDDLSSMVDYPILEFKHTALFDKIVEYGQSLNAMQNASGLVKKNCAKVLTQYNIILDVIKEAIK